MTDPSQRDLAWRGYSGWAMLPSFFVCIALSVVVLTSGWFFDDIRGILRYVPQFRGQTFVVLVEGEVIDSENFANVLMDLAVLQSLLAFYVPRGEREDIGRPHDAALVIESFDLFAT